MAPASGIECHRVVSRRGRKVHRFHAVRHVVNGSVSRVSPVHTAMRNCTRDEVGPFEVGNQVLISSHRRLLSSKAMVVIYFMHYNFVRIHQTLKVTPAMAAGVTDKLWEMYNMVSVLEDWETQRG
jgi:hypothetical protein